MLLSIFVVFLHHPHLSVVKIKYLLINNPSSESYMLLVPQSSKEDGGWRMEDGGWKVTIQQSWEGKNGGGNR